MYMYIYLYNDSYDGDSDHGDSDMVTALMTTMFTMMIGCQR